MEYSILFCWIAVPLLRIQKGETVNVALAKPANQSTTTDLTNYPASLAVNGKKGSHQESSHERSGPPETTNTENKTNQWWKVDLQENYYIRDVTIYNRGDDCCQERLNQVYILTANSESPMDPSPNNTNWTIRWYKHGIVAPKAPQGTLQERIILYTIDTVRHVAIYKESIESLSLREVEIFNYSHIEDSPHNQLDSSSIPVLYNGTEPGAAVDGKVDMFNDPFTTVNGQGHWQVRLNTPCDRCYVKVYPKLRSSKYGKKNFSKLSSTKLQAIGQTKDNYQDCETFSKDQNGPLISMCDLTDINYIRIKNNKRKKPVEIIEVQVFPREPDGGLQITSLKPRNYECVDLEWTNLTEIERATATRFKCTGNDWSTERLTNSSIKSCGHEALSSVTCQIIAIGNGGVVESNPYSTMTIDCTDPSDPIFAIHNDVTNPDHSRRKIKITDIEVKNINCNRLNKLEISTLDKRPQTALLSLRNRTSDLYEDFEHEAGNLNAGSSYTFRIKVINNRNKTSLTDKNITISPGIVDSLNVSGSSISCVNVTWGPPANTTGIITGYKVNCEDRADIAKSAEERSHEECSFSPSQSVRCTLKATNEGGIGLEAVQIGMTLTEPSEDGDLTGFAFIALVLIIPIAVIGFILIRRRRIKRGRTVNREINNENDKNENANMNLITETPPPPEHDKQTELGQRPKRFGSSVRDDHVYYEFNKQGAHHSPIKYDKFILRTFVENGTTTRVTQYQAIEAIPKGDMSASRLPENEGKNRYKGLYPVDSYRVVLKVNPTGTDYINASYIPGYQQPNKFIAAMGPNEKTLNDFLVMIWEQKVQTVVMLTRLIEDGKHKCERYWPKTRTPEKIGLFTIILQAEESWADFIVRNLILQHQSGEKHRLTQYHYINWPDHGVPDHTAPFVMFYKMVIEKEHGLTSQAPVVVHCSAGVGRTGTFIALNYLVEQGKEEKKVDFYACVSKMRIVRPSMVQKVEQYHFIHASLLDYIETENFTSDVTIMDQKIAQYSSTPEKSIIVEEYELIKNELIKVEHDYTSSKDKNNVSKIADQDILPDDNNRICLSNAATNYNNAITVSSFRNKSQFIVTQIPLAATIRDFWVMMSEKRITTIVQLEPSEVRSIPEPGETLNLRDYLIRYDKSRRDGNVEIIKLLMTPPYSDDLGKSAEEITVFRYIDCQRTNITPNEQSMTDFYRIVKQEVKNPYNTSVVMCRNGATKCGVYVNMYSILERLEIEQIVDIYRSVLLTRILRPQFINDIESYMYLYKIVSDFAASFANYSNFQ